MNLSRSLEDRGENAAPFLTIVVPAYDEEAILAETVATLTRVLRQAVPSFELLLVDDASRDATGRIVDELAGSDSRIRAFHHEKNRGVGGGFVTGIQHARGEWFMLIPADLALDPAVLPKYFSVRPADVVVGIRSDRRDYSVWRRIVSWTNIQLIRRLFQMPLRQYQYISLYRTDLLKGMNIEFHRSGFFWAEVLIKARARGCCLQEVEIQYWPREKGRATGANLPLIVHTVFDLLRYWIRGDWRPKQR